MAFESRGIIKTKQTDSRYGRPVTVSRRLLNFKIMNLAMQTQWSREDATDKRCK